MPQVPDEDFYILQGPFEDSPLFSPWLGFGEYGQMLRRVPASGFPRERLYYLHELLVQSIRGAPERGEVWECGVYQGDSALFLGAVAQSEGAKLRLFDTFSGMPPTRSDKDFHSAGDFAATSLDFVRNRLDAIAGLDVVFHPGFVPATFAGLDTARIAFAHIDLDIFESIRTALDYIFPKLLIGGAVVFDDYGWKSCPGAREAVDRYFARRRERVIVLQTGQAFVVKLG